MESDLDLIKKAFAQKYDKPIADVEVTIGKKEEFPMKGLNYASGSVKFAGEMGGGWWLAVQEGQIWKIVADGNGTVPCEAIEPYDFPKDMVPECYDAARGKLVRR